MGGEEGGKERRVRRNDVTTIGSHSLGYKCQFSTRAERLWIFQHHDYCILIIKIIDYITIMLKISV